MKLRLRTLSPLHIGTGEELTPLDYVVYRDQFYRVPQDWLFNLTERLLPENGVRALGDWVSEQYEAMNNTRDNWELASINVNMNAYRFFEKHQKAREFIAALQHEKGTPVLIDEQTRQRHGNAQVMPLGQVRGMVKNGQRVPYLPGSSIKGSLRTALFYHFLTHHGDKGLIERNIREQLSRKASKERFALPLAHQAFFCAIQERGRDIKPNDEKMDLLELVRISDAHLSKQEDCVQLGKINIYLVEKKPVDNQRKAAEFEAVQQPQASYCEMIPQGRILETDLDFDIDFLLHIKKYIRNEGISKGDVTYWIGIEKKVKQLFNLDLQQLTPENKDEQKAAVLQHLMDVWAAFSRRQITTHVKWLEHYKANDPRNRFSDRIQKGMKPVFDRQQKHLLHLGYATGFQGMTAMLYFLTDARLEQLYKALLETFGIGNRPGNRGTYKVNMERFPKSRRMIEDGNAQCIRPLGWLEWIDDNTPAAIEEEELTAVVDAIPEEKPVPVEPTFFTGTPNPRKPPELDAVIIGSGRPNKVKVYFRPDYMPELPLNGYAGPLEIGAVIIVRTVLNNKGQIVQVSFGRRK